jgi:hypothetical protein
MKDMTSRRFPRIVILLAWVVLLGYFFANTEIQIEGAHGWATALPTWRIEKHPLLDIFWGGRAMTGYHAWLFSFMFLAFHLPQTINGRLCWKTEARCIASLMFFWISEDFLWFVLNPAFGLSRFSPGHIPWHKHWLLGVPTDYLTFMLIGMALLAWSFVSPGRYLRD